MARNVDLAISESIQRTVQKLPDSSSSYGGVFAITWLARAGLSLPPWWSPARDMYMRNFWKGIDHLAGTVYTLQSKLTAIPVRIEARDSTNPEYVKQAKDLTEILVGSAGFGEGWVDTFSPFIEDMTTTDNGGFLEIIGAGPPDGPIVGQPVTVTNLDSIRCQRTGDPEYPVVYTDINGKMYKLHYTRVMFRAQMKSPIAEMYGVGFCSVSRCVNTAQTLLDILVHKQEKLGSRPHRAIIITKGGLDPEDIKAAFEMAEHSLDSAGLSRYAKTIVTGSGAIPEGDAKVIELSSLPDGFSEQDSTILGMAVIALAFGLDARELFPAMSAGATRADALLQHMKQRGKGPGQIIQSVENLFNFKYLPPHLKMTFDFQDDAQDRQQAEIRQIRANSRMQDVNSGSVSQRVLREIMLGDGDIDRGQFESMELGDGRLYDGVSVLTMFYDDNAPDVLKFGDGINPLDINSNNSETIINMIDEKIMEAEKQIARANSHLRRWPYIQAQKALETLKALYVEEQEQQEQEQIAEGGGATYVDERIRNIDHTNPTPKDMDEGEMDEEDEMMYDDKPI
jgi:hypothetical protein